MASSAKESFRFLPWHKVTESHKEGGVSDRLDRQCAREEAQFVPEVDREALTYQELSVAIPPAQHEFLLIF